MHTRNFPGKVLGRQQRALARLTGPNALNFESTEDYGAAMDKFEAERDNIKANIAEVYGNPLTIRTKKDRTSRAKVTK
jgi:hypothetical protein